MATSPEQIILSILAHLRILTSKTGGIQRIAERYFQVAWRFQLHYHA